MYDASSPVQRVPKGQPNPTPMILCPIHYSTSLKLWWLISSVDLCTLNSLPHQNFHQIWMSMARGLSDVLFPSLPASVCPLGAGRRLAADVAETR
jgi:hypothetical protein